MDVQKVIDAIVAVDTAEIEAAVTAGTMTRAQADERLANLEQHVTDEVNATGLGRGGRADTARAPRRLGADPQVPTTTPSTGTGTGTGA